MRAYKEITDWTTPNHTYLLDGTNLLAYIKDGESQPFYFKNPIKGFDKRGRKFIELDDNPFNVTVSSTLREVKGSKGNSYFVNDNDNTCTCPGFTFRGKCKHVEA
jgi:SWIM zinc finger